MTTSKEQEIKTMVAKVTGWSQALRQCSVGVTQRAHDLFETGAIDLVALNAVSQQMIAVLQQAITMTDQAANVLANLALEQTTPISDATSALETASARIDKVQNIVTIAAELAAAVTAVGAVVAAPTLAGVAAASAAVSTVASAIGG